MHCFGRAMLVVCPLHVFKGNPRSICSVNFFKGDGWAEENRSFGTFISNKFIQCHLPFVPFHWWFGTIVDHAECEE